MSLFNIYLIGIIFYSLACILVSSKDKYKNNNSTELTITSIIISVLWPITFIYGVIYNLINLIRRIKFRSV